MMHTPDQHLHDHQPWNQRPLDRSGIADYQFLASIGVAAHGVLYLAKRPARLGGSPDDPVAVKIVSGTTEDALRRFTRELQAYASVNSPHLVLLLDAGQQDDLFFSVREVSTMGTLEQPTGALNRSDALRAVLHASLAAHALHEAGLAHRDIRPSTIWLFPEGAKLGDLGLAHQVTGGANVTSMVARPEAVAYLDPASISGDGLSRASDVYSLGMCLHFALTGMTVFGELPADPVLALRTVLRGTPNTSPTLSPAEAGLVSRCLDSDLSKRPPTALELADAIGELVG